MKTGQIIRDLRTNADMSQEQLADELFVSRELVSAGMFNKKMQALIDSAEK